MSQIETSSQACFTWWGFQFEEDVPVKCVKSMAFKQGELSLQCSAAGRRWRSVGRTIVSGPLLHVMCSDRRRGRCEALE